MKKENSQLSKQLTLKLALLCIIMLSMFFTNKVEAAFVHPGISHKLSDLDRMKYMVEAKAEPWYSSYNEMCADSKASYNYVVLGKTTYTEVGRDNGVNYGAWNSDIRAAYYNAIRWYITGDTRYAEKAREIFNAWKNLTLVSSGGTESLSGGTAYIMIEAAEIIKSTYSGWSASEIKDFQDMLVYPGYSNTTVPSTLSSTNGTFYWRSYQGDAGRHGNQGLSGWRAVMAMGIFMDNQIMYDRALRYIKGQAHLNDIAYPAGPKTSTTLVSSTDYADTYNNASSSNIADYGYNEVMTNYIYSNGQCQESSRDQAHVMFGLGLLTSMSEIAWNQGEDLYAWTNSRLLLGLEYSMKYNVSYLQTYSDQTSWWNPTVASGEFMVGFDRTGRWYSKAISPDGVGGFPDTRPVYELPVAHYLGRGIKTADEVKWTTRARDYAITASGYEVAGWTNDALGWGALTYRRPDYSNGDPISGFDSNKLPLYKMNVVPCKIEAENFDYFTTDGQNRTFNDLSGTKIANEYRKDSAVTVKPCSAGGYKITDMANGEWLNYTIEIPEYSQYQISLNYSAVNAGAAIKIQVKGVDVTADLTLPATAEGIWSDYKLPQTITLLSGVQSFRVYVVGTSNTIELNSITISKAMVPAANDYVSKASGDFNSGSSWYYSDGAGGYKTNNPYTAPTTSTNVWIQEGHNMTAKANSSAKNLFVSGTLTVGNGTSTAYNLTLGTSTYAGSLYVLSGGVLTSTTANANYIGNISVTGSTIQIDGQLGSTLGTTTAGSGFNMSCEYPGKTTISGTGNFNIASLKSGTSVSVNQEILIDMDMALLNGSTANAALSLLNGDAGLATKTLTINENRNVSFNGGTLGLLHQKSSSAAQSNTGGDITYNILGSLDTGNGGLYLTTSSSASSSTQKINVNVGEKGLLSIGSKFIMIKSQENQGINFNFASGSSVKFGGTSTPVYSSSAPVPISPATFPTSYSNLTIENPKGIQLLSEASVEKSLTLTYGNILLGNNNLTLLSGCSVIGGSTNSHIITNSTGALSRYAIASVDNVFPIGSSANRYDPLILNPVSDAVFSVTADSVFSVSPSIVSLTNPTEWNVMATPEVKAKMSLSPSSSTQVASPVVAQLINGKWIETPASLDANGFSATLTANGQFGTGTLTGFGILSATNNVALNKVTIGILNRELFINNLNVPAKLTVLNLNGQQVLNLMLCEESNRITLPHNGVFMVKLEAADGIKTYKIVVK